MRTVSSFLFFAIVARFQTRTALEAERLALRRQLLVVRWCRASRSRLNLIDRLIWIWLYRVAVLAETSVIVANLDVNRRRNRRKRSR